jgi:hypothetical protein
MTIQLLALKLLRYSCRLRLPNYVELISKYDPQRGSIDHTVPHRLDQNHAIPIHTILSRENPRPLVTASTAIMIVVDFAKVSTLYPRVVISSLAK